MASKRKQSSKSEIKKKLELLVKKIVKERDKFTCQKCGKVVSGTNCHAAHIYPVSFSLRLAYDPENIIVLCYYDHINWAHKNPLDFTDWFRETFPSRNEYLQKRRAEIQGLGTIHINEYEEWLYDLQKLQGARNL